MTSALSHDANLYQLQAQHITQASAPSKPELIYQDAVQQIRQNKLTNGVDDDQFQLITSKINIDALLKEVGKAKVQNRGSSNGGVRMFRKASKASLETLERSEKAIDVMVQSNPAIASLVWGGLRFLLIIARDIFDTFERLIELGEKINFCLERFSLYMDTFDLKGLLRDRLVLFYQEIILFCLEAANAYERGKTKTLGAAIWSSLKRPFDSLLQKLTLYADEVDKAANAEHMKYNVRTQQRILSGQGGSSPSPSPLPSSTKTFSVPDLLSLNFVGRKNILAGLHNCLVGSDERSRPRKAALWGLPGVGKSQVAFRYAQDTFRTYTNVFYIRADSKVQLISEYRIMAGVLRLLDRQEADPDERLIIEAVRQWLTNSPRWLLIFDNVCDLRALRQVLPVQGSGDMLFTTRDSDTARSLANPEADFEVKRLGPDHAVEMVGKLLKEDILDAEMTASARALHQLVDGLPIAIEQTVTLASLRRVTLATILQQLQSRRQDVMDQGYQTSLHETHSSTGALFAMATESLAARHPEAAALFKVMIYLDTSAIAIEMLQEGSSRLSQHFARTLAYDRGAIRSAKEEELRATRKARVLDTDPRDYLWYPLRIRHDFLNLFRNREPPQKVGRADSTYDSSLQKYVAEEQHLHDVLEKTNRIDHALLDLQTAGLIQIYNSRMVWIHDLVRDLNVEMLAYKAKPLHQANSHLAMMLVYLAFPVPRPTSYFDVFDKCTLYLPHALSVLHHSVDFSFDTTVGPDLMHITASTLDTHRQSNPGGIEQSAKYWYYRAYAGYMKSWARLRQQVSDIETAREARNDFNAELRGACFARITTRYERFGQAPRRAIDTALKLGCVAAREKDYIDARKWINAAVNGYEKLLGPYHDLTIDSMSFLVTIYIEMGAFEEGVEIAIKRSELHKARFGPLSQSTDGAGCAAQLGCLYRKLGHQDVALEWYQLALKGQESVYGTESEFLCGTLLIIAGLLRELRRWQNAVECASRAHVLLQADGEASLRLNEVRCELALCLEGVGKPEEAKVSLGTALRSILPVNADYRQLQDFVKPLALKAAWDLVRLGTAGELNTELRDVVTKEMIKEAEEIHGALGQDSSGIISSETATNTMDAVESPDSITPVS